MLATVTPQPARPCGGALRNTRTTATTPGRKVPVAAEPLARLRACVSATARPARVRVRPLALSSSRVYASAAVRLLVPDHGGSDPRTYSRLCDPGASTSEEEDV